MEGNKGNGMFTLEEYIAPISEDHFAGIEPRSDVSPTSTYYSLKDLRNQLLPTGMILDGLFSF